MLHWPLCLQNDIGLRAANKLTKEHISFKNKKMKVLLAAQVLSRSCAASLRLANSLQISPFHEHDCLSTATFMEVGINLLILNLLHCNFTFACIES